MQATVKLYFNDFEFDIYRSAGEVLTRTPERMAELFFADVMKDPVFVDTAEQTAYNTKLKALQDKREAELMASKYYTHPTSDGNLHVPATSTTNDKKVLKAGATAGTFAWGIVDYSELTGKPALPVFGSATFSGDGIALSFTIAHSLGAVPAQVIVSPTSAVAAAVHYVSAKTATSFTLTYTAAPATGAGNGTLDFAVK